MSDAFHDALETKVTEIADVHLDSKASLREVVEACLTAFSDAYLVHNGADHPVDLADADVRAQLARFIRDCAAAVQEPENPQFPVHRF